MTIRISFKLIRIKIKSYSVTQSNVVIEFTGAENVPWGLITPSDNLIYFCVNNNLYNLSIHFTVFLLHILPTTRMVTTPCYFQILGSP